MSDTKAKIGLTPAEKEQLRVERERLRIYLEGPAPHPLRVAFDKAVDATFKFLFKGTYFVLLSIGAAVALIFVAIIAGGLVKLVLWGMTWW